MLQVKRTLLGARRLATISVSMRGAPIFGPSLTEGVGEVAEAGSGFAKGDVVFATGVSGAWSAPGAPLAADAACTVKLPPGTSAWQGAHFAAVATATGLLAPVNAGDAVLHLGAEGAVGQLVAQLCAARGAFALSLVGADVPDPEDAVDVLKNLGAHASVPAHFASAPAFRALVAALPAKPKLFLIDASSLDAPAVDALFAAAGKGVAAGRKAVDGADARDVRDVRRPAWLFSGSATPRPRPGELRFSFSQLCSIAVSFLDACLPNADGASTPGGPPHTGLKASESRRRCSLRTCRPRRFRHVWRSAP